MKKLIFILITFLSTACQGQIPAIGGFLNSYSSEGGGDENVDWVDIANATDDAVDLYVGDKDTYPWGIWMSSDYTKLYVVGYSSKAVYQYDLSTPADLSTASYAQSFSVSENETQPRGVTFSNDGTIMYVTGTSSDAINQYNLSTAWDISTASYLQRKVVSAQTVNPYGMYFISDGTVLYLNDATSLYGSILKYNLSTAWDISTAVYDAKVYTGTSTVAPFTSIFLKPDGSKFFIIISNTMYQHNLTTPWDFTTAGAHNSSKTTGNDTRGMFITTNGKKIYRAAYSDDKIKQYTLNP